MNNHLSIALLVTLIGGCSDTSSIDTARTSADNEDTQHEQLGTALAPTEEFLAQWWHR